jgi:hypothetical protein
MRLGRPGAVAVAVALAAGVAAVGVAANLHLLEPPRRSREPVVLGIAIERTTTTETTGPPVTPPSTTTSTTTTTPAQPSLRRSYAVGGAGTVTVVVRSGTMTVDSVVPGAGWSFAIEDQRPTEVEISFRSGDDGGASFHASVDGDELRVEIEPEEGESPDD